MSRQFRYRVAAIVLGGLTFGAPLLTNGWASAAPVAEGVREVTFGGGGMLGLTCRSRPDVEAMVVPAETRIRLVNGTGRSALLQFGGDTKATLPDRASTEVVFRRGTTAVMLKPDCALGDDALPVKVTAAPSDAAGQPKPTAAPPDDSDDASPVEPHDSDEPTKRPDGSAKPDRVAPGRPAPNRPKSHRPVKRRPVAPHGPGTARLPQDATRLDKVKVKTLASAPSSAAPAFAGMPPGDEKALVSGVPSVDLVPPASEADSAAPAAAPTDVAARPAATAGPIEPGGPVGLLAVIATVCAAGVSAAAIRAIVSQRANRAIMS